MVSEEILNALEVLQDDTREGDWDYVYDRVLQADDTNADLLPKLRAVAFNNSAPSLARSFAAQGIVRIESDRSKRRAFLKYAFESLGISTACLLLPDIRFLSVEDQQALVPSLNRLLKRYWYDPFRVMALLVAKRAIIRRTRTAGRQIQ